MREKNSKKHLILKTIMLSLIVMVAFTAGVLAEDQIERIEAFLRPDFRLQLDGEEVVLSEPPILYEGRTFLPVRSLSVLLGVDIDWVQEEMMIQIRRPTYEQTDGKDGNERNDRPKAPIVKRGLDIQKETIRFMEIHNYEMEYGKFQFPIVTNRIEGALYIRYDDIKSLGVSFDGVKAWEEEETGQLFILSSDLEQILEDSYRFKRLDEPVITGVRDENKLKTLRNHHRQAHYIRPTYEEDDQYEVLMSIDGEFYVRIVRLQKSSGSTGWTSSFQKRIKYYEDDEES